MKLKKILAVLCVCALAFSLAIPAFAATGIENDASLTLEGSTTNDPDNLTIAVSVLYAMKKLYVNPYGLPYTIKTTALKEGPDDSATNTNLTIQEETVTAGWFSNTAVIRNNSLTPLKVSVTISTEVHGAARVVENKADADNYKSNNCVYGTFQITQAKAAGSVITPTDWKEDTTGDGTNGHMKEVSIRATGDPNTGAQDTRFTVAAATPPTGIQTENTPAYAAFRIRGGAVICSEDSAADATASSIANVWPDEDVVDMTVAFSFN